VSLKAFHIIFIVLSLTLTIGFGWWTSSSNVSGENAILIRCLGIGSYVCAAGLLVYGVSFFKKLMQLKLSS
jgi:uncharacterized membrane protein SirB2